MAGVRRAKKRKVVKQVPSVRSQLGSLAKHVPRDVTGVDSGTHFADVIVPIVKRKKVIRVELHAAEGRGWRGTPRVNRVEQLFPRIAKAPLAARLEILAIGKLSVENDGDVDFSTVIAGLRKVLPALPLLRMLRIGRHFHAREDQLGALTALWPVIAPLDALDLNAYSFQLGRIGVSNLGRLWLSASTGHDENIGALLAASFPRLEELEVPGGGPAALATLISATKTFPRLRHLRVGEFSDDMVPLLIKSRLLPQLSSLDLSMTAISTEGVLTLAKHAKHFAHLDEISFEDCLIDKRGVQAAKKLAKVAIASDALYREARRYGY